MRITTFYSYKGGVGRTLTCANYGIYLAKTGRRVLLLDMDFEAPGLDCKFFTDATTNISNGLIDQVAAFQNGQSLPGLSPSQMPLADEVIRAGGSLQLIPAGNYGVPHKYYETLSSLDWKFLLRDARGLAFWFDLLNRIRKEIQPDDLIIDSRTGYTEIGGLCTQVLPDKVLLLTSTSWESMNGTRHMYEIIRTSRAVKEIRGDRPPVDLRVVVTRLPPNEDREALDRRMRLRLNLEIPQLYYVFASSDLANEEFLAMNSSAEKAKPLLADYVALFESLNPEDTVDYVKSRLASFREKLTVRKEEDSRREIQELLTLFPRAEVYLEAARYYRLVKEPEDAIICYLRYLKDAPNRREIIVEFAEVCVAAPLATVTERRDAVVRHLATLGPANMDAAVLALFRTLTVSAEHRQLIVAAIEDDKAKLTSQAYRDILFRALIDLNQWEKVVASATDLDAKSIVIQRALAKAYAKLHAPDKALQIAHRLPVKEPSDAWALMEIFYDLRADADKPAIHKAIRDSRHLEYYISHFASGAAMDPQFARRDDGEFRSWIRELLDDIKSRPGR